MTEHTTTPHTGEQPSQPFAVSIRCSDAWTFIEVAGDLDMATADFLEASLHPYRDRDAVHLFDLGGVSFVDVVGIRPILDMCRDEKARIGATSHAVRHLLSLLDGDVRIDPWFSRRAARAS